MSRVLKEVKRRLRVFVLLVCDADAGACVLVLRDGAVVWRAGVRVQGKREEVQGEAR